MMNHEEQALAQARAVLDAMPLSPNASRVLRRYVPPGQQPQNAPTFPPLANAVPADAAPPPATKPQRPPTVVMLACGADLNPEPVRWLWPGWLALGKLHILAGAPGQGKTTIAMALAATVTQGGSWPDRQRSAQGNVLIWSGEDDPADTLLPRLLAAGAERGRCYFIQGTRGEDGSVQPFDPAKDLPGLRRAIERIGGVSLLVVDPVVSAVTGDSHKNTEVRRSMQPLVDLAAAVDCAVLGITHFAKGGQGQDPAQRVVGSVAFTAVARVVMVAAKVQAEDGEDGEKADRRILARSKSNIGPDDGGFEYHLEQTEVLDGIQASRIAWGRPVEGSARELLTDPNGEPDEAQDAIGFLRAILSDGPMAAKAVFKEARDAGYSEKQMQTAARKLYVLREKRGMEGGWFWVLGGNYEDARRLEDAPKMPKVPCFKNRESSAPSGESSAETSPALSSPQQPDSPEETPL